MSGAVRHDRKACLTKEWGDAPDSQLFKVMATSDRYCNINYVGMDTSKIDSFTEGPLSAKAPFEGHASSAGDGIWFGICRCGCFLNS